MKLRRMVALLLAALMVLSMVACGSNEEGGSTDEGGVKKLTIPTYFCGENVGGVYFVPAVERFNKANEGKYEVIIEETVEQTYSDTIKSLATANKLPAMISTPGTAVMDEILIPGGMVKDVKPLIDANPEVAALFLDGALEACTVDGKVVAFPSSYTSNTGLFYNSKLLGFDGNICDLTVDEFIAKLGDNKVALQTVDNAWTSMLLLTSFIANEEGGYDWLWKNYTDKKDGVNDGCTDFSAPCFVNAMNKFIAMANTNKAANSVGAAYADAANAFFNEQAAVIANGPWMNSDFTETGKDNWGGEFNGEDVIGDFYPGNVAINGLPGYGRWMLTNGGTEAEQEVAEAFIVFLHTQAELEQFCLIEGKTLPKATYSAEFTEAVAKDRIFSQQVAKTTADTKTVPSLADGLVDSIGSQVFGVTLTSLYNGTISVDDFCKELTTKSLEAVQ